MNETDGFRKERVFFPAAGRSLAGEIIRPGNSGDKPRGEEGLKSHDERRPWLVFLHEGLGSIGQWRDFPALIAERTGLPALVYDRWGYGGSAPCPEVGNVAYLHNEALNSLPRVLDHFGIDKSVFIGHSDGGSIALMFAATFPEPVAAVITEAAHVFVEEITLAGIHEAVAAYAGTDLKARLAKYHGEKTDLVFRRWSKTWLSPAFRHWNIEEFLPRVRCPVLAIQGADDPYGTPAQVEAIIRQTSGQAEGFIVPGCGHIPHSQAREEVAAAIAVFIRRLGEQQDKDRQEQKGSST